MQDLLHEVTPLMDQNIVRIAAVIIAALILQSIVERYIKHTIDKIADSHRYKSRKFEKQRQKTLGGILRTAADLAIWIAALIVVLGILNVNVGALVTGASVVGIIVGLGAQNTIKDFIGGLFVIAENQYRIGDVIAVGDKSGVVEDITIRITRLRDLNGNVHIIPNGRGEIVTNKTFDFANVNLDIGVSPTADIDKVAQIVNEEGQKLAKDSDWKDSIVDPIKFLRIESLGELVKVKVLGKVAPGDQWDVGGEFLARLKKAFAAKKIKVPGS